jgi:hypothetical protein
MLIHSCLWFLLNLLAVGIGELPPQAALLGPEQ